ncbi:PqiC family protein [Paraburkholderia jirisanensis]
MKRSAIAAARTAPAATRFLTPHRARCVALLPALLVTALIALGGCSSPGAAFYTLSPDASLERTGAALPITVLVGPVTVPELLDRPQLVTRVSDNEVAVNEFARWGEPLKSGVARTLAANLELLLGAARVSVPGQAALVPETCRVRVDVVRFDALPGEAVTIDAQWVVRVPGKPSPIAGRSVVREPVSGAGDAPLVAAQSRALARVSRDIAAAIRGALPA